MTKNRISTFVLLATLATVLSLAGCAKKVAKVTPPSPPAARRTDGHSGRQPQRGSAGPAERTDLANQQCQ